MNEFIRPQGGGLTQGSDEKPPAFHLTPGVGAV